MKKQWLFYASFLLGLWSCQQDQVAPSEEVQLRKLSIEEKELIQASNKFAIDLTREILQKEQQNVFFSPYYIHMDLSMAINGAENGTLTQMQKVQQCDVLERLEVNKVYNVLNPFLRSIDEHVKYTSSHAIWYHQDIGIRPLFSDMMTAYYGASVEPLDFNHRKSSSILSKWVEDNTSGKIKVQSLELLPTTAMYVLSATHVKGYWTFPFAKEYTASGTFYTKDKEEITVPMMFTDQASYRYFQDAHQTLVDIPYGNQQYSMTILMPHEGDSIASQLVGFNAKSLDQYLEKADTLDYHLYLPKFTISSQIPLKESLSALGIREAFSDQADFSGILNDSTVTIKVADMIHHAGIEVNESGIQTALPRAAAANATINTPVVRINRPFIFFIRENHTGVILYTGVLQNPVAEQE